MAGGEDLGFNNAIFLSEREAADRNYALGFYMREYGCYPAKCNFKESMDFYFQVITSCRIHYMYIGRFCYRSKKYESLLQNTVPVKYSRYEISKKSE